MQERAENQSRRQRSKASASEAMTPMARPLMALKINCRALTNRVKTSFTYVGSYADSRMACQFIAWQLAHGFENMKPSAGEA
jgi:hypothetical protein